MNYVVFGLGILLTAAGSLSVYAGYDIVQVERGWTEVIAGSTAVTGGIITIALGMVLHRLKALGELYKASAKPLPMSVPNLPTPTLTDSQALADPLGITDVPVMTDLPVEPPAVQVSSPPLPESITTSDISPSVSAISHLKPKFAPASFRKAPEPPLWPPASVSPASVPLADEIEPETGSVSATFADTASGVALPKARDLDMPVGAFAEPREFFVPEQTVQPSPQQSPSSLSLDEMWKRVSDEIEKPIFAPRVAAIFSRASEEKTAAAAPSSSAEASPIALEATAPLSAHIPDQSLPDLKDTPLEPEWGLSDWEAPMSASRPSALDHGDDPSHRFDEAQSAAPVDATPPAALNDMGMTSYETLSTPSATSDSLIQEASMAEPPAFTPSIQPEPTVIGRYEAEGTAYLMFSDGSIEAQSEAGIFRFASMGDLKAFIESKQAAEP